MFDGFRSWNFVSCAGTQFVCLLVARRREREHFSVSCVSFKVKYK
jgi:hypothetical protein